MKQIFKYILVASMAVLAFACQKEINPAFDGGADETEGCVKFNIAMSNSTRAGDTMPEDIIVRVYQVGTGTNGADKLIRVYQEYPIEDLYLIAGNYKATVEVGDKFGDGFTASSLQSAEDVLSKLFYTGAQTFTVTAGKTTPVTVNCLAENVKVDVVFDETAGDNARISNAEIGLALGEQSLTPEINDSCYFLLSEDEEGNVADNTVAWSFKGTHTAKDGTETSIDKSGEVEVEKGKAYKLKFVFSKAPDGTIVLTVLVEQKVQGYDDFMSFKPQPEFEAPTGGLTTDGGVLTYQAGQPVSVTVQSINPLKTISVKVGTGEYQEIWNNTDSAVASDNFRFTVEDDGKKVKIDVNKEFFAGISGGMQNVTFKAEDTNGGVGDNKIEFKNQGLDITATTADLWLNTATFNAVVTDASTPSVKVQYRRKGTSEWAITSAGSLSSGNIYAVTSSAQWTESKNPNNHTIYTPNPDKSIFANSTYECQLVLNDVAYGPIAEYTTTGGQTITDATFENTSLSCWGTSNTNAPFWGSGNNGYKKELCVLSSYAGQQGSHCAKLAASETLGMLASGNLFTGTFAMDGFAGTVSFGVDYPWAARPTAIKLKIWHKIGDVTTTKYSSAIAKNSPDQASIYCSIINWDTQHQVTSGASEPTGVWSPENGINSVSAGEVIGYGVTYPQGTTAGSQMVELVIPIQYYDKVTKPSKKYKLIIAAATSRYGDYMNGCNSSEMYVDDFQWVY